MNFWEWNQRSCHGNFLICSFSMVFSWWYYLEHVEGWPHSSHGPDSSSSLLYSYVSIPACLLFLASSVSYLTRLGGWRSRRKVSYSSLLNSWNASGSGMAVENKILLREKIHRMDQWWPLCMRQSFMLEIPWCQHWVFSPDEPRVGSELKW